MNKEIKYEKSDYKTNNNLSLWKWLKDENHNMIYAERNYSNRIEFNI